MVDPVQLVWIALMFLYRLYLALWAVPLVLSAPPGFPASGNGLWFTSPGQIWSKDFLPIGNGYLAAMTPGGTTMEALQLNIESLWSGGPFQDPTYNGGNKQPDERAAMADAMSSIRQSIFTSSTGDIDNLTVLATDPGAYGSYSGAGYLVSTVNSSGAISNYSRYLDLDQALAKTQWTQSGSSFVRTSFCSNPTQACTQHLTSSFTELPALTYVFSSALQQDLVAPNVTCLDSRTLIVRGLVADPGMIYEILFRAFATSSTSSHLAITCQSISSANATLTVKGAKSAWISWVGDTEYSMDAGDEAHDFSFKGPDPHNKLVQLLSKSTTVTETTFNNLLSQHVQDFESTFGSFQLSLGETPILDTPTDALVAAYAPYYPGTTGGGSPYLESLTFTFGRYLLHSSTRSTLPANLQGKWALGSSNPWSGDYHSNINIQMNYWSAEMSFADSKEVIRPLFDYIQKTWAPRGAETALVLYNISRGWVTHNEMNVFGHTGFKAFGNSAEWADYPESAVWMMIHVWDHFDHTNDIQWWKTQGWPLIKGVVSFHLDKLIPDLHFNDSTLVVNPCNSPEQVPITLGCAHAQQLIWQLLNAVEKGFEASGDTDQAFLEEVQAKRAKIDRGLHIGSWGQLQEWKVDQDSPTDTHRHLSHLIGLYPGYAIASYDGSLNHTKDDIIAATTTSLIHRGNGTGPDADSGWEKAWRAASWAQLQNSQEFYRELTFTISENLGPNLFSLYNPFDPDPIFQIDANLGFPGALLNALIQAPDVPSLSTPLMVTLLPALPQQWAANGHINGARIRGGMTLDLEWTNGSPTALSLTVDSSHVTGRFNPPSRPVALVFKNKVISRFTTSPGMSKSFTSFH
ncbi:glycoside hydrolase family 95 protein [Mycena floridula]|nr:glycoside hydrolase family 95 protein [Mycena floridula]